MICIINWGRDRKIAGWIIAHDVPEARRNAQAADQRDLAAHLYRMELTPAPGLYELPTGHTMLVT